MNQPKGTWTTWVDSHYELLLSRASALFRGNTENAADFLHDLLLELRRKWDTIDNPLGWISRTMRFRIVDYLAQDKVSSRSNVPEETQHPADVPLQMDMEAAMKQLPKKLQDVLSLFLEGNSIPEIAAQTKLSTDAVYQRLSRARKKLKEALGEKAHGTSLQACSTQAITFPA